MKAVSFYGFGGAYAVALQKVGIDLEAIVEPGGFGLKVVLSNAARLGFDGPHFSSRWRERYDVEYPVVDADILIGNPPCSGFSLLNTAPKKEGMSHRGVHSPINDCMWHLIKYAAKMNDRKGPKIVCFESVQGAGKQGRPLMQALVDYLREETGEPYVLYHVFMSGASVGAAQVRKRYFFVASKIPFGITSPQIEKVCTYEDSIGDLRGLKLQADPQPYVHEPTWWVEKNHLRSDDGMVTDFFYPNTRWARRMAALTPYWKPGETQREALNRAMNDYGVMPEGWENRNHWREFFGDHFSGAVRIRANMCGRVITGSGATPQMHYEEDRPLTIREGARLMGFPDWYRWNAVSPQQACRYLGKQVPVQSWEWILRHISNALSGNPGAWRGQALAREEGGVPEVLFDVTRDYKQVYHEIKKLHGADFRNKKHLAEMQLRPA